MDGTLATRTQVRSEMSVARVSGQMEAMHGEDSGSAWLSRQHQPQSRGMAIPRPSTGPDAYFAALVGEDSGSAYLSSQPAESRLTRAQVKAQVAQARALGELHAMHGEDSGAAFLARQREWIGALYAGPNAGQRQQTAG